MPALLHSLAPAKFGSTVVPIKSFTVSAAIIAMLDKHSGNEYATLVKVPGAEPRIRISMPFRPAYDLFGFGVYKATTLEVYLAKFIDFARTATSTHTKWALATNALAAVIMTGISVDQDGDLMAEIEAVLLSPSATLHPLAKTDDNGLPTLSSQPSLYTLGPISINGTVRQGLMSAGVDLGQALDIKRHDGNRYPLLAGRLGGAPRMFGEHGDPVTLLGALGLLGTDITSNLIQYYRKYDATTGVVSDDAGSAVSLTMASGRIHPTDFGTSQLEVSRSGFEAWGLSATSAHPVAVSTSATVPAIS